MSQSNNHQPDSDNSTIAQQGIEQTMPDNLGITNTQNNTIDEVLEDTVKQGVTPIHHQNIDESRIDEVLVEDNLDDKDYPTIRDIADNEAVEHSFDDDL